MIMKSCTRISEGNRKMGAVPSVSLLPIKTCPKDAPCKSDCYVVRNMLKGPHASAIKRAYAANTVLQSDNRRAYFAGIREYLHKRSPERFRWHVSGDIPDEDYLLGMVAIADEFPKTRFLAFTKNFELLELCAEEFDYLPDNLTLRASQWYGRVSSAKVRAAFYSAWYSEDGQTYPTTEDGVDMVPAEECSSAFPCCGDCSACTFCWQRDGDVRFHRH